MGDEPMTQQSYKTLSEAVEGLRKKGYTANFEFLGKTFKAVNSGKTFRPDELTIVEIEPAEARSKRLNQYNDLFEDRRSSFYHH